MVGLAIDVGYVLVVNHQLQNAADAAALAAAHIVRKAPVDGVPPPVTTALDIAARNKAAGAPVQLLVSDIVIGRHDPKNPRFPLPADSERPNAVQVTARHAAGSPHGPHNLLFGPVFGVNAIDISRTAVAVRHSPPSEFAIMVLNRSKPKALQIGGSLHLEIANGGIGVNSTAGDAAYIHGGAGIHIDADVLTIMGDTLVSGSAEIPPVEHLHDFMLDPLRDIPEPDPVALDLKPERSPSLHGGKTVKITDATASPDGYHYLPDGIRMNNGRLELAPGVYILGGQGLQVNGGTLIGHGVMFYIMEGSLDLGGNAVIDITPPALPDTDASRYFPAADVYNGISFWQSRDNKNQATVRGTEDTSLDGTLYFPSAHFVGRGNSFVLGSQLIADTADIQGDGTIAIDYRARDDDSGYWSYLIR